MKERDLSAEVVAETPPVEEKCTDAEESPKTEEEDSQLCGANDVSSPPTQEEATPTPDKTPPEAPPKDPIPATDTSNAQEDSLEAAEPIIKQTDTKACSDLGQKAGAGSGGGWGSWGGWGGSLWSSVSTVAESAQALGQKV